MDAEAAKKSSTSHFLHVSMSPATLSGACSASHPWKPSIGRLFFHGFPRNKSGTRTLHAFRHGWVTNAEQLKK